VGGTCRVVRLIWTGDVAFLSSFSGHEGATTRFPCVSFPSVIRPGPVHAELIAKCGNIQRLVAPPAELRTRQRLLNAMEAYETCNNEDLTPPLAPWPHLLIFKRPLMATYPREVAVIPMHATLGGTISVVDLGLGAVYGASGASACKCAAEASERSLLEDIRVSPVLYQDGAL